MTDENFLASLKISTDSLIPAACTHSCAECQLRQERAIDRALQAQRIAFIEGERPRRRHLFEGRGLGVLTFCSILLNAFLTFALYYTIVMVATK